MKRAIDITIEAGSDPDAEAVKAKAEEERLRAWREARGGGTKHISVTGAGGAPAPDAARRGEQGGDRCVAVPVETSKPPTAEAPVGAALAVISIRQLAKAPPIAPRTQDAATSRQEADRVRAWRASRAKPEQAPQGAQGAEADAGVLTDASAPQESVRSSALPTPKLRPAGPATVPTAPKPAAPSPDDAPAAMPEPADVSIQRKDPLEEQREKLRRRLAASRRRFWGGITLLAVLPALLAASYEYFIAVPLYEAQSVIAVAKASNAGEVPVNGLLGALGGGSGGSNMGEAFMAHEYVQSQALLEDLERELGLVTLLSGPEIDPLRRLHTLDLLGINQRLQLQRFLRSSVNVQTGMMTLYVRAPSPELVVEVSNTILGQIETRINELSDSLFVQQLEQTARAVEDARQYLLDTQAALTQLQITSGEANIEVRVVGIYDSIASIENELLDLEIQIAQQELAGRDGSFEIERLIALRDRLEARIALMRRHLVEARNAPNQRPLNEILLDYQRLQLEMEIGQESLSLALAAHKQARERAALGRSQFQVVVPPRTAEIPWRPRPISTGIFVLLVAVSLISLARLFRRG